jgi:pyrroloquinoline quinone biosynthesis protein D
MKPAVGRPKLASKVRLHFDRHSSRHWLLLPERGLVLNDSAARIAALCNGERTVELLVEELVDASGPTDERARVATDVREFLCALEERALILWV